MSPQRKAFVVIVVAATLLIGLVNALAALTPAQRQKVQLALDAVNEGLRQNEALRAEADQAHVETKNANDVAMMAAGSAFTAGVKAQNAVKDAEQCKKQVAEWEPIIKAVTGPWWFPGGRALIYGAEKSTISLLVIIVGGFVLFLIIKILLTVFTGGTFSAGLGAVGGIFGAFFRWLGRAGKRLLSFFSRRGKAAVDKIEHHTIGSDPPDEH